jgi:predicted transcriptional regulator
MDMGEAVHENPLICSEEVDIDLNTGAAIERGIRAADAWRVVSSDEARKLVSEWISKYSTPTLP